MVREEKIKQICEKLHIDRTTLPNKLDSTLLKAIATACGCSADFADNLYTTFLKSACTKKGVDCNNLKDPNLCTCLIDALYDALQEVWKTVTGVTPLTLQNAVASAVQEFELKGKLKRTITIDNKEYVIPDGYTLLESITSSGTQYIETGLTSFKSTYKIEVKMLAREIATKFVFGQNPNATSNNYGAFTTSQGISFQNGANTRKTVQYSKNQIHTFLFESDGISIDGTKTTIEQVDEYTVGKPLLLLGAYNEGTVDERMLSATLYYAKVKDENGTLLRLLFPMKNASNVVGLYDFITNTFKTNAGTGTYTGGAELPNVDNPIGVKGVGEKTDNLFDTTDMVIGENISASGVISQSSMTNHSNYISVEPNTVYTVKDRSYFVSGANQITRYHAYGSDKSWLEQMTSKTVNTTDEDFTVTFTTPSNCHYVMFTTRQPINNQVIMLVKGSVAPTEYIPFGYQIPIKNNNQVVATIYTDELLGNGTYQDTLTLSTQKIKRKFVKKVFDGTENFVTSILDNCWAWETRLSSDTSFTDRTVYCNYFKSSSVLPTREGRQGYALLGKKNGTGDDKGKYVGFGATADYPTENEFKAMLAQKYAEGNPLYVWHLADTETEEAVELELSTSAGTNVIDVDTEIKPTASITYLCTDTN